MNGPRVLLIDDDEGLCRLATRALGRRGFGVTTASSGEAGIELASGSQFDVVAVDHYMPGLDGLATLERLRKLPDAPPVVYVTGSDEGRIAVAALKAGAADYVVKTVSDDFYDLLAAALEQVLAREQLAKAKLAVELELRASNARLEALLGEVNHRVANSLQLVSSMVGMQTTALTDPSARDALRDTQRRITAIGQVHRRLYSSSDVENVEMQEYLKSLIAELSETWSSEESPRTLSLSAEPIKLPTDKAVSVGVIVTELVTNACKYAYPKDHAGGVRVGLHRSGQADFMLTVEDDGCGLQDGKAAQGTGLGTKLIGAMAKSLRSAVHYDSNTKGLRATLIAKA